MKKILSILIISILIICSFGVQGFSKQNNDLKTRITSGDYFHFIIVDGRIRSYHLHIPPSYNGEKPISMVFSLHGDGFPAVNSFTQKYYYSSDMDQKADDEGFIVVYPNGGMFLYKYMVDYPFYLSFFELLPILTFSRQWNHWNISDIDDVGFIRTLIDHLQAILKVDSSRIYITGLSGGAMMTYQLGSELSDVVAAIAPVAGASGGINSVPEPDNSIPLYIVSKPVNPLPIMILYGMKDISYEGGWFNFINFGPFQSWGYLLSAEESVSLWVEYNNCDPIPRIDESESGSIITKTYVNGSNDSEVVFVTYVDGEHEWFKSPPYEISATDLMWEFFEQHPKQ